MRYIQGKNNDANILKKADLSDINPKQNVILANWIKVQYLPKFYTFVALRRGVRVAERASLESSCICKGTVGSNPTLSAD